LTRRTSLHPILLALVLLALPGSSRAGEPRRLAGRLSAHAAESPLSGSTTMYAPYPYRPKEFALIHDGVWFHLFYMRHSILAPNEDSTEVDLGHAVSLDLAGWIQRDPVLHVRPGKWDDLHIWAPTIISQGGTYYMYYAGVTRVPYPYHAYQRIGVATSTDLVNWTRYDAPVFDGNRVPWALADSSRYEGCQFRDPFVMPDPANPNQWLMYFAATPRAATSQLIAGVGFNETGLSPWQDLKPLWNTDAAHYLGFVESPCVFDHAGRWYLFFTTNSGHPIRYQHAPSPTADSSAWVGNYRLFDDDPGTDDWFGPEFLRVGEHEYFAAANSETHAIEIREMVWSGVASFSLVSPTVVAVPERPGPEDRLGIVVLGSAEGGGEVEFRVTLPQAMKARIAVHDVAGRKVRVLGAGPLPGGATVVGWDRRNGEGREVATGMYLVTLETPLGSRSAKVHVLR
jgi:glycosyl hydrolase family 43/flagellar hook capping protein FlgD